MLHLNCGIRSFRPIAARPQRHVALVVRAQAGERTTSVRFKIHRHVEYGQSLLIVGNAPELGAWDAKQAVELSWGEGDNWSATVTLPQGAAVEYKYITKRKDGLDWCPGQNKTIASPPAAAIEVADTWDNHQNRVVVLTPAAPEPEPEPVPAHQPVTAVADVAPAPQPVAAVAQVPPVPPPVALSEMPPLAEALAALPDLENYTAVSTVENLHVAELEGGNGPAAPNHHHLPAPSRAAPLAAAHQEPPPPAAAPAPAPAVFLANNIVQGAPPGAVAVGAVAVGPDPITEYEEADKYQEVVVGAASKAAAAEVPRPTTRPTDSMTVSELRTELKKRGMSSLGSRRELIVRLQKAGVLP